MGLTHAHTAIYKIDKQQGPSYSTGNYTQCSVITYNGKEYIYIYIYIYIHTHTHIYMNHFAVYQKLTQHCKSIILQFLNINYIVYIYHNVKKKIVHVKYKGILLACRLAFSR